MGKIEWHIESRKLSELKEWDRNPRILKEKGLEDLKASIDKFGLAEPIIINTDNQIIGGHARFKVLQGNGDKQCDCYVPNRTLTDKEVEELNIRLNANIAGEFNFDILANEWDVELLANWGMDGLETGWKVETDNTDGDNIENELGYNLSSVWKDMPRKIDQHRHQIDLPYNHNGSTLHSKYSRTILEEIRRIIATYMRDGDYFLENCCGWSTFGSMAKYYGYSGTGIDIWEKAINHSKKQIMIMPGTGKVKILEMDGMKTTFKNEEFDYIYCNPPFMDEEKYSGNDNDIADGNFDTFASNFKTLQGENYRILKRGGVMHYYN